MSWKPVSVHDMKKRVSPNKPFGSKKQEKLPPVVIPEDLLKLIWDVFPSASAATGIFMDKELFLPDENETVFVSPSPSHTAKFIEESAKHHEGSPYNSRTIMLVTSKTEAFSWHIHVFGKASVLFIRGPVKFENSYKKLPCSLLIYGKLTQEEETKLQSIGHLYK